MYDFTTHSRREDETRMVEPADVIMVEGILVLHMERIRCHLNMKVQGRGVGGARGCVGF